MYFISLYISVFVLFLCTLAPQASLVLALERSVNVDVSAQWPRYEGSFAAEISEFLSLESPHLFWKYTNKLYELEDTSQTVAFETAQDLLPQPLHTLLDTVLGLSVYAPTVEFFRALSSEFVSNDKGEERSPCGADAWAVVYPGRHIICNPSELSDAISSAKSATASNDSNSESSMLVDVTAGHTAIDTAWDHTRTSSKLKGASKQHAVVYGSLGSKSFCMLHQVVLKAQEKDVSLQYSARHAFPNQRNLQANTTRLQGFGVYLDIKNMEYKNVDDTEDNSIDSDSVNRENLAESFPEGEDSAGVLKKEPSIDLLDMAFLKDELIETDKRNKQILDQADTAAEEGDITHMKLWKMKDLGVQTVHTILNSEVSIRVLYYFLLYEIDFFLYKFYCF